MTDLPPPSTTLLDGASLFLDFDGTLVNFVIDPAAAEADQRLRALLCALSTRLDDRLAILSGRSLDDVTARIGLGAIPMAGSHGLERRSADGHVTRAPIPPTLAIATHAARDFATAHDLLLEPKAAGVALHYRDSQHAEAAVDAFAHRLAEQTGLELQKGKCVRELKVLGANKGDAVRAFMTEPPFLVGSPVVVGDDLTDEHAFIAAAALGGHAILVGDARPTAAQFRLPTVEATLAWLGSAL
ncbi:MAG: trehalose-phosphatase [Sphingomonas bacterium]|nr:trehalose-phosphatase [Sphingomonas bacterium]